MEYEHCRACDDYGPRVHMYRVVSDDGSRYWLCDGCYWAGA